MPSNTPNYLVIGASKCGTSSLCQLLGYHPDVFMSSPKEPNFFCYDHVYEQGWSWYLRLFENAGGKRAIGEGTTQYSQRTVFPNTLPRIVKHLPGAKLIYIVRHPLERMVSLWYQLLEHTYRIPFEFNAAIREDVARFIDSSNYLREIDAFRDYYPDERILVLFFEDFKSDPYQVLSQAFAFLGVDPTFRPSDALKPRNVSTHKRVQPPWMKRLYRTAGYDIATRFVPRRLKSWVVKNLRIKAPPKPVWKDETRRWVINQIGDDTREFLLRYGKSIEYWPLENREAPHVRNSTTTAMNKGDVTGHEAPRSMPSL